MKKVLPCFVLGAFVLLACLFEGAYVPTQAPAPAGTARATQPVFLVDTVDPANAPRLVKYLLETDTECKLPCWWGIIPGQTTWKDARQILEKTALSIEGQELENDFYASVKVHLPYPYDFAPYMEHQYSIKNGVVDYIRIYNFDLVPQHDLEQFLQTYGPPTEVWMRTFAKPEKGIQNFTVILFYPERGVLIEYATGEPLQETDGKLQNCLVKDMDAPILHVWSALGETLTFEEAKFFLDRANLPEPKFLPDAAGMDAETFYETFQDPETDVCLQTPKDLWP